MASAHTIDVGGLFAGGPRRIVLDDSIPLAPFEGIAFPQLARVHLKIARAGSETLDIAGTIDAVLGGECVRCLGDVEREMHVDVDERIETAEDGPRDPLGEGNVLAGNRLDVAFLTTQLVCSAIPIGLLCKEDCRGICPQCGVDRNMQACRHMEN